jgi:F-type H+-transporting ATPase subunit b
MLGFLTHFANAAEVAEEIESGDIFSSLGIDWQMLGLQMLAFVILVIILAKFIYPQISAMLDRRDKVINDAIKAAQDSEAKAAKSEAETAKALAQARQEASEIVDTAKQESTDILTKAETEATKRAFNIVASARADLDKEVEAARRTLRSETLDLVATATEKIASVKLGANDEKIVSKALKETK